MKIHHARVSDTDICLIPKRIGAYVITHTPDNIHAERYAGSSENLHKRKFGHYNKNLIYIDLYITDDIGLALSLERILMELIDPATNIRIPSLSDNDRKLMKELLDDDKIKEILNDNIIKKGCRYLKYVKGCQKREIIKLRTYIRKIGRIGENSKYILLPKGWGEIEDLVKIEVLNENELLLKRVDIVEKRNGSNGKL